MSPISGSAAFALSYVAKSVTDTRSELGLRADKSFADEAGALTLRGRLAWAHDQSGPLDCDDLPDATRRKLRRQRRGAGGRLRAHLCIAGDEMAERLVGGCDLRRRILQRHPAATQERAACATLGERSIPSRAFCGVRGGWKVRRGVIDNACDPNGAPCGRSDAQ
jgi:hypothetical protein